MKVTNINGSAAYVHYFKQNKQDDHKYMTERIDALKLWWKVFGVAENWEWVFNTAKNLDNILSTILIMPGKTFASHMHLFILPAFDFYQISELKDHLCQACRKKFVLSVISGKRLSLT